MTTIQRAWWTTLLVAAVSTVSVSDANGQMGFGQPGYPPPQPGMMAQGGYGPGIGMAPSGPNPGWGYAMPANSFHPAPQAVESVPAFYQEPVESGDEATETEPDEEYLLEGYYSGHRRHGYRSGSLLLGILGMLAPYGEGGCCAPHWFDLHAEFHYLSLDNHGPLIEFTRDTGSTTRITSADLEYGDRPGFRVTGTHQTGPGSNLEFTYLGMFDFNETTQATGVDELNSVLTNFTGPAGIDVQEQFDLADLHEIRLENDFDSLELNYRRRWLGPTCLFQGSWMVGVRYVKLRERLRWLSIASRDTTGDGIDDTGGEGYFNLDATNYMTGPQIGGDLWMCICPGFNVGVDGKFALLGNNAKQHTEIFGIDLVDTYVGIVPSETTGNDKISFLAELSLNATYRLNHRLTFRAGYELVWIEGVALALENFNPEVPLFGVVRTPGFSDGGNLLYNGWTIGGEWMW